MKGNWAIPVIVGVLILSIMGFTDLFAEILVANFTAYEGSTVFVAADSVTGFDTTTVFDPSILGGEMELSVLYNLGPGASVALIDAGPGGLLWILDAETDGHMEIFLGGPAGVGLGVDLSGEDALRWDYGSNPFAHTVSVLFTDSVFGGSSGFVSVPAGQLSVSLPLSSLSGDANFENIDEIDLFFTGIGGSTMEITSISTSVLLVGGSSIPIDTTSLLLAGATLNVWMIPVVLAGAGFGILIARKI